MRLLHTKEFRFQGSFNVESGYSGTPPYAILSHRWGKDEILYHHFLHLTGQSIWEATDPATTLAKVSSLMSSDDVQFGFSKIIRGCHQASKDGYDWFWVDTCCIDKNSSAELSEAINSMYSWYEASGLCYAYLVDVKDGVKDRGEGLQKFGESEWFTRGWTLQELLAPSKLHFVDREWRSIGSKEDLCRDVSTITGIPVGIVSMSRYLGSQSVAAKMSWAAKRETTNEEDRAYCLLGIFGVNIPLLYGEGNRAFKRLQEEIIRQSDDETIFVHRHSSSDSPLAASPDEFASVTWAGTVKRGLPLDFQYTNLGSKSYTVTNKGIQMTVPFVKFHSTKMGRRFIVLNCHNEEDELPVLLPVQPFYKGPKEWAKRASSYFVEHTYLLTSDRDDSEYEKAKEVMSRWRTLSLPARLPQEPFVYETIYLSRGYWSSM